MDSKSRLIATATALSFIFPLYWTRAEDFPVDCDPLPYRLDDSSRTSGNPVDTPSSGVNERHDSRLSAPPNAPLQLIPKIAKRDPVCKRLFLYRGKLSSIDSYNRKDGERLRPIISEVPRAVEELDQYQANRRKVRLGAYVGTAGLLIALGSTIASGHITDPAVRNAVRNIGVISGLSIGFGFAIYSFTILSTNESHLQKAVNHYNEVKPNDPIQLQLNAGILF